MKQSLKRNPGRTLGFGRYLVPSFLAATASLSAVEFENDTIEGVWTPR